jgi:radical SAM superfamily enzyme YgiQ (UPF0313 family)
MKTQQNIFSKLQGLFSFSKKKAEPAGKPFRLVLTYYSPDGIGVSLPIACLSAYVKQEIHNIEVYLVDINLLFSRQDDHTVTNYVHRVTALEPDLIGISCMSLHWHPLDAYLRALKSALPDIPVLIGGYQAVLAPDETITHPAVDFICVGDGELPLAGLIRRIEQNMEGVVPGLWEKKGQGEIVKTSPVLTEDLSIMPFPDYTIFERNGKLDGLSLSILGIRDDLFILPVMTGRGCPHKCTYCSNSTLLETYRGGSSYLRKYEPEALIKELCRLRDHYQVGYFEFWDELFLFNMKYVFHFLELYKKHLHLPFSITSRVEKMDEAFCNAARDAGCYAVWFGLESGSESYRHKYLNRKMTNEQIIWAAENARKAGIRRVSLNMIGMPFESRDDMLETLEINKIIQPELFQFFPYMPLRGTALYELAEREGLLLDEVPSDFGGSGRAGQICMNLKPHPGSASAQEFNEICNLMAKFQRETLTIGQGLGLAKT